MTQTRRGGWLWAGFAVWVFASGLVTPQFAQAQSPLQITPNAPSPAPTSTPAAAAAASPAPADPAASPKQPSRASSIEVKDLKAVTLDGAGLIDSTQAGLPADVWNGTGTRKVADHLIAAQKSQQAPALSSLQRRLLITSSQPPGQQPALASGGKDGTFLEARIQQLVLLGMLDEARALADAVPAERRSEAMVAAQTDSLLINGDSSAACGTVQQWLQQSQSPAWQKAMVYCETVAGHSEGASIQTGLLRDQGEADNDPMFFWAAESLSGLQVLPLETLKNPTPITMVMIRSTPRPLPTGTLVSPPAWMARTLALSGQGVADNKLDPLVRAHAAEYAFAQAALSREALITAYEMAGAASKLTATPLESLAKDPSPAATVALWLRAKAQGSPAAQAEVIAKAWEQAGLRGFRLGAAALYAPLVQTMQPTPDMLWFAGTAARILLGADVPDSARAWLMAATTQPSGASELGLLNRLAFGSYALTLPAADVQTWRSAQTGDKDTIARREQRLLTLLKASGDTVDSALWEPLWSASATDSGLTPSSSRWQALSKAAEQKRVAETIALVMLVADGQPLSALSDGALSLMIESLRRVGLISDARTVAIQAAIASGL